MKKKVLVIVGPTAVGKSALAVQLAEIFRGEVISGDSQQVYRGLNIGTAKISTEEMQGIPHHLLDIRDLTEKFSAHDFVLAARTEIEKILRRGKVPIICGGTGLYIQALLEGYHLGGEEQHQEMMALRAELETLTNEELKSKIHLPEFNRRRAIRALELQTYGRTENKKPDFDFQLIGISAAREQLYERINRRIDLMMSDGLLDEARRLFEEYPNVQAAKAIGYKEFFPYFSGEGSLAEAVEKVKQNSRHYAKRQLTWFRNRMQVEFQNIFSLDYPENVIITSRKFLD